MDSKRFIKIRVQSRSSSKEYDGYTMPRQSKDCGRYIQIALADIVRQESIWWEHKTDYTIGQKRYVGGDHWVQLPSPPPDDDSRYVWHCLIVLSDQVIITQENFAEVEQLIIEATNRQ